MPELPEVETVVRSLRPHVTGKRIAKVTVRLHKLLRHPEGDAEAFCMRLEDCTVQAVSRRGKYIVMMLDRGWLVVHLGMTGKLLYRAQSDDVGRHDHVLIDFSDSSRLVYEDARRFGGLGVWEENPLLQPPLSRLGPEPFSDEFNGEVFYEAARKSRRAVKAVLLDQHVVAGIGNIYADEILFAAGVRPRRGAYRLTRKECICIAQAAEKVLRQAIDCGGSTIRDYVDADQRVGSFQLQHQVYGRAGEPCRRCGATLKKVVVGGRSSVYCPHCQK